MAAEMRADPNSFSNTLDRGYRTGRAIKPSCEHFEPSKITPYLVVGAEVLESFLERATAVAEVVHEVNIVRGELEFTLVCKKSSVMITVYLNGLLVFFSLGLTWPQGPPRSK